MINKINYMQNISVEELKARIDAGEKLNLIDVREDIERLEFLCKGFEVAGDLHP